MAEKQFLGFWFLLLLARLTLAADPSHLVTGLPGQPAVSFKHYAGQMILNNTGKALFYWFYEADQPNAASLPLVLWLNGGPGCSSVGAGALRELGPFKANDNGKGLSLNPFSWNKAANVIFLESPIGVGFSYSKNSSDYAHFGDGQAAADNVHFLLEFFKKYPEYKNNDFYVTGESYAGHYIPTLATRIVAYNNGNQESRINLKGIAIGNAWTDSNYEDAGNLEFQYSHSMISYGLYVEALKSCYSSKPSESRCIDANKQIDEITQHVNPYNVYVPICNSGSFLRNYTTTTLPNLRSLRRLIAASDPCSHGAETYLNSEKVQAALHVDTRPVNWNVCSDMVNSRYSTPDILASMLPLHKHLMDAGIRVWIFSGDVDSVVSTLSTRSWLRVLDLTIKTSWYPWNYKGQVGGWTEVYSGLTFATVRGSGHMVPVDQPGPALQLFQSFISGKPLPSF